MERGIYNFTLGETKRKICCWCIGANCCFFSRSLFLSPHVYFHDLLKQTEIICISHRLSQARLEMNKHASMQHKTRICFAYFAATASAAVAFYGNAVESSTTSLCDQCAITGSCANWIAREREKRVQTIANATINNNCYFQFLFWYKKWLAKYGMHAHGAQR